MLRSEIPFSRDDANRFLPWMVAMMCAITALMLCVGLTFGHWVQDRRGEAGSTFIVQIPPQGEKHEQTVHLVTEILDENTHVQNARLLSADEVRALVEPWLGGDSVVRALPLPSVIQAENDGGLDFAALAKQLKDIAPDISVDTQEIWAEKFARLSTALQAGAFGFALCIALALAGMMAFTSRVAMKLHADTVTLLHSIGAEDRYIARQFQANAMALALRGALPGTIVAGVAYALFGIYAAQLDAPLMPNFLPGLSHLFVLMLLPAACCVVSIIAARHAALAQLRLLP